MHSKEVQGQAIVGLVDSHPELRELIATDPVARAVLMHCRIEDMNVTDSLVMLAATLGKAKRELQDTHIRFVERCRCTPFPIGEWPKEREEHAHAG